MGKIKTKLIKRTGDSLAESGIEFNESFEENKKRLGNDDVLPSKKIRNQVAGYLARIKKQERKKLEAMNIKK